MSWVHRGLNFCKKQTLPTLCLSVEVKTKASRSQNLSWKEEQQTGRGTSFTSGLQVVVTAPQTICCPLSRAGSCSLLRKTRAGEKSCWLLFPTRAQGQLEPGPCKGGTLSTHSVLTIIWERHFHGTAQYSCGWTSCTSSLKKYRAMHWGKSQSPLGKEKYLESKLGDE